MSVNRKQRGFTLVEALVALFVLSLGLLGASALLFDGLRTHRVAMRQAAALRLARDMTDRIRANPLARMQYDTRSPAAAGCGDSDPCDAPRRAAADRATFLATARGLFAGRDTAASIEFEPATGPAAPDRYRIRIQWRGPHDADGTHEAVTLHLLARPVAG